MEMAANRVGQGAGMERQRLAPVPIKGGAGQTTTQAMRAGWRHARRARRASDAATFEQGGEEEALPGRSPVRAGGGGCGLLFHPTG